MKPVYLLLLLPLVIESMVYLDEPDEEDKFLFYNKRYPAARLAQWGTGGGDVGTYDKKIYADQVWRLEPSEKKPWCYYIVNDYHPTYRLADSKHKFIVYNGPRYDDQLFRFRPAGDDYYYIYNCYYKKDRIAKYGAGNRQVTIYSGPRYEDQKWKLVPKSDVQIVG